MPARGLDPHPVVVVPSSRRGAFLAALAAGPVPDWLSVRDPAQRGWHERRGTVAAMTDDLARRRTASLLLEPWPMRGGHDGVLGEGVEVGVQFWEESPDGDLVAPGLNRFGDRVPAGAPRTTTTVEGVEVPTLEVMALPTVDDVRFDVDVVYTWVDGDDEAWMAARDARITGPAARPAPAPAAPRATAAATSCATPCAASTSSPRGCAGSTSSPPARCRRGSTPPTTGSASWTTATSCPPSALPTFNSHAIETRLHGVPDLADHFVYVNDDVFLGRPRRPEHFFTPGGQSAAFVADHRAVGLPGTDDRPYLTAAQNNRRVLADAFGVDVDQHDDAQPAPAAAYDAGGDRGPLPRRGRPHHRRALPLGHRPVAAVVLRAELRAHHRASLPRERPPRLRRPRPPAAAGAAEGDAQARPDFFCIADNLVAAFDEERADGLLREFLGQYFPIAAPWEK